MKDTINLAELAKLNGKLSVSVESEIETRARVDRETSAARAKLFRGNMELVLLSLTAVICLWFGVFDLSDSQRVTWCRAAFLAILSYLIGRQVGKGDPAS